MLALAICQMPTQVLTHLPHKKTCEENKMKKLMSWWKKYFSQKYCHHGQNRLDSVKINLIYCQLKTEQDSEKQRQKLNTFFLPSSSSQAQLHSFVLLSPTSSEQHGGMGNRVVHTNFPLPLLPSHTLPLLQHGVSCIGCSSRTAPAWGPYHGWRPLGTELFSEGPPLSFSSCQATCMISSSKTEASSRSLVLFLLFMGCSFLQGTSTCCGIRSILWLMQEYLHNEVQQVWV